MPLVIGPNEFTQPDYTVTNVDGDRRLTGNAIYVNFEIHLKPGESPKTMRPWPGGGVTTRRSCTT